MYQRKKTAHRVCKYCNKEFMALQKEVNRGGGVYCNQSCVTAHKNKKKAKDTIEIFQSNIIVTDKGCWEYQVKGNSFYGKMTINGKDVRAHRFIYEYTYGVIPESMLVCHKCDNPPCCNPDHLFLGTSKDNTQDMLKKSRGNPPRGNKQPHAKLNEDKVKIIKKRLLNGGKIQEIANDFNVGRAAISQIKRNKNWSWVKIQGE